MRVHVIVALVVVCSASRASAGGPLQPFCTVDDRCLAFASEPGALVLVDLDAIVPATLPSKQITVTRADDTSVSAKLVSCGDGRRRCVRLSTDQVWNVRAGEVERTVHVASYERVLLELTERAMSPDLSSLELPVLAPSNDGWGRLGGIDKIAGPDRQETPRFRLQPSPAARPPASPPLQSRTDPEPAEESSVDLGALIVQPDATAPAIPITGGAPVVASRSLVDDAFAEVVLVGSEMLTCSGIVVAPRVVLTAAHCVPATRVVFAARASEPVASREVSRALVHPAGIDAALLFLSADAPWRTSDLRRPHDNRPPQAALTLVGFGIDNPVANRGFGVKRRVSVMVNGWGCDGHRARQTGCDPGTDLVIAGQAGRDTCDGDSGGPVFEWTGRTWRLVAITSRPILPGRSSCGRGGIYTRVDRLMSWMAPHLGGT